MQNVLVYLPPSHVVDLSSSALQPSFCDIFMEILVSGPCLLY